MGRDVDLVVRKLVFAEVFEEVGVSGSVEVHVGVVGVFGLWILSTTLNGIREGWLYHFLLRIDKVFSGSCYLLK